MTYMLAALFVIAAAIAPSFAQSPIGYELPPRPTYIILAPQKFRPGEVYQVSVSALRLVYKQLTVRISVKHATAAGNDEFCFTSETFTRPSTRIMQLKIPETLSVGGSYWLHLQGSINPKGGLLFQNRTRLEFEGKKVSVFIQTSKPLYHQGQIVRFRIIPIRPNLLPEYSTMSRISIVDATGTTVRMWHNLMTNAGGVIGLQFQLAKQVAEGDWKIRAIKDGFTYEKKFRVIEYWQRRFDVNVTMPRRFSQIGFGIFGLIMANHTSGRPVKGNATVLLELKNPNKPGDPSVANATKYINVFEGKSDFLFTMEELKALPGMSGKELQNYEVIATVRVFDWFLLLEYSGRAYSYIYPYKPEIKILGGMVRPFKPDMPFTMMMVLWKPDETEVKYTTNQFVRLEIFCNLNEKRSSQDLSIPDTGVILHSFIPKGECPTYRLHAKYMERHSLLRRDLTSGHSVSNEISYSEQFIFKYFSSSKSYLQISTSTPQPKVNEYMILNVLTNYYVETIHYQIVAGGNIIFADKLDMPSNTMSKTFSIAVSRDMAPVVRVIAFYVKQDGEVVSDALTFYVNIERLNTVKVEFNRGKDFNVDEIEVNAYADPGAYIAFSAIHYDLFVHGGSTILQDYDLTDELAAYESHAQQPFNHTWYDDREILNRLYFPSPSIGADTNSTMNISGLIIFSDANHTKVNFYHECNETLNPSQAFPCYSYEGQLCYSRAQRCNGIRDCNTGYDEVGCQYNLTTVIKPRDPFLQFQSLWRHFDDGGWMWKNLFVKPDGRVDFRVKMPKIDTSWMVGAFAVGRDTGFSIMHRPATLSGIRRFFITVEMPKESVWGEQIGIRVAVFNYWNYWIESLVEIKQSSDFDVVWVEWTQSLFNSFYTVNSYSPQTVTNKTVQSLVYLQAGESKYIYFPFIPRNKTRTEVTICAYTFIGSNCETRSVSVRMNGVPNYYHTPVELDLTLSSAQYVKNLDINVPQMFWEPEARQLRYIPDSPKGSVAISGDVLGPTLSKYYKHATTENVLRRPDDACENVLFEFGYNAEMLLYLRDSNQLANDIRDNALDFIYLLLQRLMSYFNHDVGGFASFREEKNTTNPFLAAFGIYVLMDIEPLRKELETVLYIPTEVMFKLVNYLQRTQLPDGSFPIEGVRDRKFTVDYNIGSITVPEVLRRVPVTAMVVLALSLNSVPNSVVGSSVKTKAVNFLVNNEKQVKDPFSISITTYALMSGKRGAHSNVFNRLKEISRYSKEQYWANQNVPDISTSPNKAGQIVINPRIEWPNDGYATQTTAFGILSYIGGSDTTATANVSSITKWLQTMRNTDGGFASTQDTFWAMKALREVAARDRDRGIYALKFFLKLTSLSNFQRIIEIQRHTLSTLHRTNIPTKSVWGEVVLRAEGTGRALMQLDVQVNVQENNQIKKPYLPFSSPLTILRSFEAHCEPAFSGRNASIMHMKACGRWIATDIRGGKSGLAVFEIDLPTGFVVMNDDLRRYVTAGSVPSLRRAIYRPGKIHFYFDSMTGADTCVTFRADRWYPVANMTLHYMCSLYEYYEPGRHNTTAYEAQSLFSNSICNVCGSYQCPYCPDYNVSTVVKCSTLLTLMCLLIAIFVRRHAFQLSSL